MTMSVVMLKSALLVSWQLEKRVSKVVGQMSNLIIWTTQARIHSGNRRQILKSEHWNVYR